MSNHENEFFSNLTRQAMKDYNTSDGNGQPPKRLTWVILGILAFVGIEAVKVTFRKNFGANGINMIRLLLCSICFLCIAAISFYCNTLSPEILEDYGLAGSFVPAAIFYIVLAIFILARGLMLNRTANSDNPDYKGDSFLLSFLMKDGWSQNKIQNIAEPLMTIAIGTAITFINWLWGVPIIFCGLSVWAYSLMGTFFFEKPLEQNLSKLQDRQQAENQFHKIS